MPASKIKVRAFRNQESVKDTVNIDSAKTYEIDFSPWAEEFNNVTTVTWTVKNGQAAVSGETLSSNVATALITFNTEGRNLIQIKGDSGTEISVVYLDILVKDPETFDEYFTDYI